MKIIKPSILFVLFLLMIPLAGLSLKYVGDCSTYPCTIPVWFDIRAPSGVIWAGLALVLRDLLQRSTNVKFAIAAVIIGTIINYGLVDPAIALGACSAYFLSEISDTIIYSFLQKYNLVMAIIISACVGVFIDTFVFLQISFHDLSFFKGQLIGKMITVIICIPVIKLCRKYL